MRTKQDYSKALAVVSDVIRQWDPYSLLSGGAPANEFEAEIAKVVTHIPRLRSAQDAAQALSAVFSEAFEAENFSPSACAKAGAALFEQLIKSGLITHAQQGAPP